MYTINFVTPGIGKNKFSGGLYCILKYADGLARKGHNVNVIPSGKSNKPSWIECVANMRMPGSTVDSLKTKYKSKLIRLCDKLLPGKPNPFIQKAFAARQVSDLMVPSDITIATSWDSVEYVYRYGTGKKAWFMQHFESLFFDENSYERHLVEMNYFLPIYLIANSTWLKLKVESFGKSYNLKLFPYQCTNAVDLDVYKPTNPRTDFADNKVKIISYGTDIKWKGFEEMIHAVGIARKKLPDYTIDWLVYGTPGVSADNEIAPFKYLGFLKPKDLCNAYNDADILLSASWYESFPLFPIEAMACGLAVITTVEGTEDYAVHGETAEIVRARDPEDIARGIVRLVKDREYRKRLAINGEQVARRFTWDRSIERMEQILQEIICSGTVSS